MRLLAVETATSWQSVALIEGDHVLACADLQHPGTHGRTLMPAIDRLLKETKVSLRELDGFAVSIGPGSFTGLRVGLATVLGFRLVTGLPLATIPTLEGLAWNLRGEANSICTILGGRTGEVYWAVYRWTGERAEILSPPRVGPPGIIGRHVTGAVTVVGDGWVTYRKEILAGWEGEPPREAWDEAHRPSAVSIARAGQAQLHAGQAAGPEVAPLYVQRAEAELVWEARQQRQEEQREPLEDSSSPRP